MLLSPDDERTTNGEWNERAAGLGVMVRESARVCFATERRVEDIVDDGEQRSNCGLREGELKRAGRWWCGREKEGACLL